jgi:hypothetical protein
MEGFLYNEELCWLTGHRYGTTNAINCQRVSGDEGSRIRTQPDDRCGDLLRLTHPSYRLIAIPSPRPSEVPPVKRLIISVSINPGQTALTRMFDCV